jgi:hypothetical protein
MERYARRECGMNDGTHRGELVPHESRRLKSAWLRAHVIVATLLAALTTCFLTPAHAQSGPTASRLGDLQVGGGFVFATSNYNFTPTHLLGGAAYTTLDLRNHWGGEFNFRQIRPTSDSTVYERTFEIGPRIFLARGPIVPYAKVLYGRGVYNFSGNVANLAFNMYTYGGGVDVRVRRWLNVRGDYEYQNWLGFPLGTLHPNVVTIGVAYHFHE